MLRAIRLRIDHAWTFFIRKQCRKLGLTRPYHKRVGANRALALRAKPASGLVASRIDHGGVRV